MYDEENGAQDEAPESLEIKKWGKNGKSVQGMLRSMATKIEGKLGE